MEREIKAEEIINKPVDQTERADYEQTFDERLANGQIQTEEVTLGGISVGMIDVTGREKTKNPRFGA